MAGCELSPSLWECSAVGCGFRGLWPSWSSAAPGEHSHLALAPAATTALLEFHRVAVDAPGAEGQCIGWLLGLGATMVPAEPTSTGARCVGTLCCLGMFASRVKPQLAMSRAHSNAPGWILVQAITSPCALHKAKCGHCPSLGFTTPEGLRLMRKSCPPRPLGPSLPTQSSKLCTAAC